MPTLRHLLLIGALCAATPGCKQPTGEPLPDAAVAVTPVVVGALIPVTTIPALESQLKAIRLAIDEVGGKLGDRPIVLEHRDVTAVDAAKAAQALIEEKGATLLLTSNDFMAVNVIPVAATRRIPVVELSSSSPQFDTVPDNDFAFRLFWSSGAEAQDVARVCGERAYGSVAVLYDDHEFGKALKEGFEAKAASLGIAIKRSDPIPMGVNAAQATTLAKDAQGSGAQAVVLLSFLESAKAVLGAGADGTLPWVSSSGVMTQNFPSELDPKMRPRFTMVGPVGLGGDAFTAFTDAWQKTHGDLPPGNTFYAYDGTALGLLALAQAGEGGTGTKVRDALREVSSPPGTLVLARSIAAGVDEVKRGHDIDYKGASGNCDFDEKGNTRAENFTWSYDDQGNFVPKAPVP